MFKAELMQVNWKRILLFTLAISSILIAGCLDETTTLGAKDAAEEIAKHVKNVYTAEGKEEIFNLSIKDPNGAVISYIRVGDRLNASNQTHGYDARPLIEWESNSQQDNLEVRGNDGKPVIMTSASQSEIQKILSANSSEITSSNSSWSKQLELYEGDYTITVRCLKWNKEDTDKPGTYSDKFVLIWIS